MYDVFDDNGKVIGKINFVVWSDYFSCPNCGQEYSFWTTAIDRKNKCIRDVYPCPNCGINHSKKDSTVVMESYLDSRLGIVRQLVKYEPVIIAYKGINGGKMYTKSPSNADLQLIERINEVQIPDWYPIDKMPDGSKTADPKSSHNIQYVHEFFSKRNLYILARLLSKINNSIYKQSLRFLFTGILQRSSKMNRVHVNNYFNGGGGWNGGFLKGTLYVPNAPTETSIIEQISDKLAAISRLTRSLPQYRNNVQYVGSATKLNI
ncbi:MAG: hypothetical protein K2H60_11600 [Muribaculaceae bacterium]|nr:hypothetical protein [Muribaculaceae bacterium]